MSYLFFYTSLIFETKWLKLKSLPLFYHSAALVFSNSEERFLKIFKAFEQYLKISAGKYWISTITYKKKTLLRNLKMSKKSMSLTISSVALKSKRKSFHLTWNWYLEVFFHSFFKAAVFTIVHFSLKFESEWHHWMKIDNLRSSAHINNNSKRVLM